MKKIATKMRPSKVLVAGFEDRENKTILEDLKGRGHSVLALRAVEEIEKCVRQEEFDAILFDATMFDVLLPQLISNVRSYENRPKRAHILVLDSFLFAGYNEQLLAAGADLVMPKASVESHAPSDSMLLGINDQAQREANAMAIAFASGDFRKISTYYDFPANVHIGSDHISLRNSRDLRSALLPYREILLEQGLENITSQVCHIEHTDGREYVVCVENRYISAFGHEIDRALINYSLVPSPSGFRITQVVYLDPPIPQVIGQCRPLQDMMKRQSTPHADG